MIAELGDVGVGAEVLEVERHDLPPAKSPRVGHLEDCGVAQQGKPRLARLLACLCDLVVGEVEESLDLRFVSVRRPGTPS